MDQSEVHAFEVAAYNYSIRSLITLPKFEIQSLAKIFGINKFTLKTVVVSLEFGLHVLASQFEMISRYN